MKKIKLFFKQLFIKKIVLVSSINADGSNSCQIWEVERGSDDIVEALGIFEERSIELSNLCHKTVQNCTDVVSAMVIISKECKHANELYFCSMIVTKIQLEMEKSFDPFLEIIKNINKKQ
jgi:hypothetical protein